MWSKRQQFLNKIIVGRFLLTPKKFDDVWVVNALKNRQFILKCGFHLAIHEKGLRDNLDRHLAAGRATGG
jgi:hypothetical protein